MGRGIGDRPSTAFHVNRRPGDCYNQGMALQQWGIVLAIVLSVLVYVAVLVVAAAFVEPTVATGEDSAAPIAEDIGPLGLEIAEGEGSDSAAPIAP